MSDAEIKRYCINRAGNGMEPQELGAFCFHHEIKDLIAAKNARIAELEAEAQESARVIVRMSATIADLEAQLAATPTIWPDLMHRLALHADDVRNTAFSRSTMNELLQVLNFAQPAPAQGEPTEAMIEAGARYGVDGDFDNDLSNGMKERSRKLAAGVYRAMIAAQGERQPVGIVRHFVYKGIARNGPSVEATLFDGVNLPDGTHLYAQPAPAQGEPFEPEHPELIEWVEEAVEYVNKESRSPSLEAEGRKLLRRAGVK
jgi:hypothetical protein